MKTCEAWINDVAVGELREEDGSLSFIYNASWAHRSDGFPLAHGLPLRAGLIQDNRLQAGVSRFVESQLPPQGVWLMRLAMEAGIPEKDRLGMLLHYGEEGVGGLSWRMPGRTKPISGKAPLSIDAAGEQICAGRITTGGLLPGMTPKMAVIRAGDGSLTTRAGLATSTHILKAGRSGTEEYALLVTEWLVQGLAAAIGLNALVPEIHYWKDGVILMYPRFDRLLDPLGRHQKLCISLGSHLIDSALDLPLSPDALGRIEGQTLIPIQARLELFRWALFNTLVGNTRVHINKLAGIRWTDGWALAPFFGLKSHEAVTSFKKGRLPDWDSLKVPLRMGEQEAYSQIDLAWMVRFGEAMGIGRKMAESLVEEVVSDLQDAAAGQVNKELRTEDKAIAEALLGVVIPSTIDLLGM